MPTQQRTRLRKREILFALAMGAVAAGGSAALLSVFDDTEYVMQQPDGIDEMAYTVGPFTKVSTEGPQDVQITYGEELSVRAESPSGSLGEIEAVVENGRLTIRPKRSLPWTRWERFEDATFHVTMPRLESIVLAGSGDVTVNRIEVENFEATISGPGDLTIAEIKADEANLVVNGSGDLGINGVARNARIQVSGEGEVQATGLHSTTASVTVFGEGEVGLTVNEEAQVSVTGAGEVNIGGAGKCSVTRFGPAQVRCAGGGGDEPARENDIDVDVDINIDE